MLSCPTNVALQSKNVIMYEQLQVTGHWPTTIRAQLSVRDKKYRYISYVYVYVTEKSHTKICHILKYVTYFPHGGEGHISILSQLYGYATASTYG